MEYRVLRKSVKAGSSLLTDVNTAFLNPVPLLYQSGYLTIRGIDPRFNLYTLGFPNMEVKDGFLNFLLGYYAPVKTDSTPDEGLAQIEERGYARPFADDPRKVFRIGVNFSTANRRIDGWKVVR